MISTKVSLIGTAFVAVACVFNSCAIVQQGNAIRNNSQNVNILTGIHNSLDEDYYKLRGRIHKLESKVSTLKFRVDMRPVPPGMCEILPKDEEEIGWPLINK